MNMKDNLGSQNYMNHISAPLKQNQLSCSEAMASKTVHSSLSRPATTFLFSSSLRGLKPVSLPLHSLHCRSKRLLLPRRLEVKACVKVEEKNVAENPPAREWGKVSAVLFDMDGVLCNSEDLSRRAAVDVFAEMGVQVTVEDFVPFMGTGTFFRFLISELYSSLTSGAFLFLVFFFSFSGTWWGNK